MPRSIEIPRALLLACSPFNRELSAQQVARALAAGLAAGGRPAPDALELPARDPGAAGAARLLEEQGFDARMRASRAVVIAVPALREETLAGSLPFEIATRSRQGGVPCYAVAAENRLDGFDERILDLQAILQAGDEPALRRAGRRLAEIA